MAFLRFIFSSFWVWAGFIILVAIIGGCVIELVKVCKRNRKITGYRIGQRWHIEIENASTADVQHAIISEAYAPGKGWDKDNEQEQSGEIDEVQ